MHHTRPQTAEEVLAGSGMRLASPGPLLGVAHRAAVQANIFDHEYSLVVVGSVDGLPDQPVVLADSRKEGEAQQQVDSPSLLAGAKFLRLAFDWLD